MALRPPPIILFDDGLGRFGPLTDLRASFELRTGALTTAERWQEASTLWATPGLVDLVRSRQSRLVNELPPEGDDMLLVNGRVRDHASVELNPLLGGAGVLIETRSGHVLAARLPRRDAIRFLESGEVPAGATRTELAGERLFGRPWEVLDPAALNANIGQDIAARFGSLPRISKRDGVTVIGSNPAVAHAEATVSPGVIVDAEAGAVAIDSKASIRPGAVLVGPCFIGAGTIVAERTLIKARTVIGPHCRVAGEIGSTIFQGYSNKAHDGHLGDSFIGEWVNLGAGTTNSNLLNTYGEVTLRLDPESPIERTGRQFVGAIIGDHAKTAILTRLPTGCVVGTGSMIATTAFAPSLVPRFSWMTDEGHRLYRFEKFLEVAATVWARRGATPADAMIDALRRLHGEASARFAADAGQGAASASVRSARRDAAG